MRQTQSLGSLIVLAARRGLVLGLCAAGRASSAAEERPVTVEKNAGHRPEALTLSAKAAERLGIADGRRVGRSGRRARPCPYAAVIYDASGKTWATRTPRAPCSSAQPITVDRIEGDLAYLSGRPARRHARSSPSASPSCGASRPASAAATDRLSRPR